MVMVLRGLGTNTWVADRGKLNLNLLFYTQSINVPVLHYTALADWLTYGAPDEAVANI
jgi:hypothetical protein